MAPVDAVLKKLAAMRCYMRDINMGRDPDGTIPAAVGMSEEDIKLLATMGHIVSVQQPDSIVSIGESGREVFVILDGSFQVLASTGPGMHDKTIIKMLGPGDVFGEIAFLTAGIRCASVAAAEESTVLVLNAKALDRLSTISPKVAVQFFRNLARILAIRLRDSLKF